MKCVKYLTRASKPIVRVSDEDAQKLVKTGYFEYASKSEWKKNGRRYSKGGKI